MQQSKLSNNLKHVDSTTTLQRKLSINHVLYADSENIHARFQIAEIRFLKFPSSKRQLFHKQLACFKIFW